MSVHLHPEIGLELPVPFPYRIARFWCGGIEGS